MKKLLFIFCVLLSTQLMGQTITVTNPSGGTYDKGCTMNIQWSSSGIGNVSIELVDLSNTPLIVIADPTTNTGSFDWIVGEDMSGGYPSNVPGGDYKIKIYETGTGAGVNYSNTFSISTPVINISVPNGGENYPLNGIIPITWNSSNFCGDVSIELTDASNTTLVVIVDPTSNTGSFSWTIPGSVTAGDYKIKIYRPVAIGPSFVVDYSDAIFTIGGTSGSSSGLEFSQCIVPPVTTLEQGDPLGNTTMEVRNIGTQIWAGNITVALSEVGNSSNNALLEAVNFVSIFPNQTLSISTGITPLSNPVGNYVITVSYNNAPTGGNDFVSAGTCTPTGTATTGTVYHYVDITITASTNPCNNINDIPPTNGEALDAAICLCNLGYVTPQNGNVNPTNPIIREDLAKVAYLAVSQGDVSNPAENFPSPFADLQNTGTGYHRYAKALSYLEYGDGITPFDRKFPNFYPGNTIPRKYALKVILEAFNIQPDNSNGGTIQQVNFGEDAYGYVHEAWNRGYITSPTANSNLDILREDVFIIIYRILSDPMNSCSDCQVNCWPTPANSDYFVPGNFQLEYLARGVGMSEGYFDQYSKTSFHIPGKNLPLNFTHMYNTARFEIPSEFRKMCPLGEGWSHTYNSYIVEVPGSDNVTEKYFVIWSDGSVHMYDKTTLNVESKGVFDIMTTSMTGGSNNIHIRKKNQIEYTFSKFNSYWYLSKIKDRNNNEINLSYEYGVTLEYEGGTTYLARIYQITGTTASKVLNFVYSTGTDNLLQVEDQAGNRYIYFNVDASGNLASYTNPRGDQTFYTYGVAGSVLKHYLHKITLPRGNEVDINYGANRKLSSVQFPNAPQAFNINVTHNYSSSATNVNSVVTSPNNIVTTTDFDDEGYPDQMVAGNSLVSLLYNNDKLPSTLLYEGQNTFFTYDNMGNVTTITQLLASGNIVEIFEYNSFNDIIRYEDGRGFDSHFYYDSNSNLDYMQDNLGEVTDFTFNGDGLLTQVENAENIITGFTYDNQGNQTGINGPLNINSSMSYDAIGRLSSMSNPNGQVTNYNYDVHDLVTSMTRISNSGNISTSYNYDENDNLVTVTNAMGNSTTMTYDDRDLVKTVNFGGDTQKYSYREDNLLDTLTRANGNTLVHSYDNQGRLISDDYVSSYIYDDRNNILSITVPSGTTSMTYDDIDRLGSITDIYNQTVNYDYDENANITKITYPNGYYVDYIYDANNRLTDVEFNNNSKTISYTYFKDGRLKKVIFPNGTYTDYGYDAAGRMTSLSNKKSDGSHIASFNFTLDMLGNHTQETTIAAPYSNMISIGDIPSIHNGTYDTDNDILEYAGNEYVHNSNGEQTRKEGRYINYDNAGLILNNGRRYYTYDGLRLMRRANRQGEARRYVWDISGMGNIIVEMDDNNNPLYYYIHGMGLCARVNANNNSDIRYYHFDFRGSTIAMTDETQNVTHQYQYLPFGEVIQFQEDDVDNRFKYVGQWGVLHEGGNHYYMRARQYDAESGRFLSEDPIWSDNLFEYSSNSPVNYFDPLGENDALVYGGANYYGPTSYTSYSMTAADYRSEIQLYGNVIKAADIVSSFTKVPGGDFLGPLGSVLDHAEMITYAIEGDSEKLLVAFVSKTSGYIVGALVVSTGVGAVYGIAAESLTQKTVEKIMNGELRSEYAILLNEIRVQTPRGGREFVHRFLQYIRTRR